MRMTPIAIYVDKETSLQERGDYRKIIGFFRDDLLNHSFKKEGLK